jgi:glycosyltransferase involved in cell wall biosynthesis
VLSLPSIVVIIAAYNEERGIGPTLAELREILDDPFYLVMDGNSSDRTVEVAKEMGAQVFLQEGCGKGSAIAQALGCVHNNPEYVAFIDADFSYPAKYILDMVQILEKKPSIGMVLGNRFNSMLTPAAIKNPYYIGNRLLSIAQRLLNRVHLNDPLTGLRIARWEILKSWTPKSKGFDIEAEMNHRVERQGYQIAEIAIHYRNRLGEKKLRLRDGFNILKRIILESLDLRRV